METAAFLTAVLTYRADWNGRADIAKQGFEMKGKFIGRLVLWRLIFRRGFLKNGHIRRGLCTKLVKTME